MSESEISAAEGAFWAIPPHTGIVYWEMLSLLHTQLRPRRYLEIGTENGASLKQAKCASIAIDPKFGTLDRETLEKPACLLFQMTSDTFFESYSPTTLLNGPLDIVFLDGMHLYEFLLRDFIHVERHCRRNSVVLLHDCLPPDANVARRGIHDTTLRAQSLYPNWWAGDVWKAALIIRKLRPELKMYAFDAPPTGLVAITNLDPASNILERAYYDAVAEYRDLTLGTFGTDAYLKLFEPRKFSDDFNDIAELFWL